MGMLGETGSLVGEGFDGSRLARVASLARLA